MNGHLVYAAIQRNRRKREDILVMQLLQHTREGRGKVPGTRELEVPAASLSGQLLQPWIRPCADLFVIIVHVLRRESNGIHHHVVSSRAIGHGPQTALTGGVVTVGEHENHLAALDRFQLVQAGCQAV